MLIQIAVVLIILWFLGIIMSFTLGGLIHALLVVALIIIVVRLLKGQKII
ncbi:MAG: lmo0937 family membrane protein [Patescibacteria group bacterium]|jgi:hypothetical protein|nr:lmo0937 family membrane protein [Patescibacteria group bacterium]